MGLLCWKWIFDLGYLDSGGFEMGTNGINLSIGGINWLAA
jgi:hypothetical protein